MNELKVTRSINAKNRTLLRTRCDTNLLLHPVQNRRTMYYSVLELRVLVGQRISLCKSLRGASGTPAALHFSQTQSPLFCTAKSYGDFSSWHWNPAPGSMLWGWDHLLLCKDLCIWDIPSIFNHHKWVWDQSTLHLCPFYQSGSGFCFSLVVELLVS